MTAPSTNPKLRPSTRPAGINRKNTKLKPVAPPDSGRSAAPQPASTPSTATALASMPCSLTSARTTASSSASSAMNSHGASSACAVLALAPASRESSSGQPKPIAPTTEAANRATADRGRSVTAEIAFIGCSPTVCFRSTRAARRPR